MPKSASIALARTSYNKTMIKAVLFDFGGKLRFPQREILDAKWFTYEQVRVLHANGELRTSAYVVEAIGQSRLQ